MVCYHIIITFIFFIYITYIYLLILDNSDHCIGFCVMVLWLLCSFSIFYCIFVIGIQYYLFFCFHAYLDLQLS